MPLTVSFSYAIIFTSSEHTLDLLADMNETFCLNEQITRPLPAIEKVVNDKFSLLRTLLLSISLLHPYGRSLQKNKCDKTTGRLTARTVRDECNTHSLYKLQDSYNVHSHSTKYNVSKTAYRCPTRKKVFSSSIYCLVNTHDICRAHSVPRHHRPRSRNQNWDKFFAEVRVIHNQTRGGNIRWPNWFCCIFLKCFCPLFFYGDCKSGPCTECFHLVWP